MQERSHGALTFDFFVTPGARGGVPRGKFIVVVHFGQKKLFLGKDSCDVVLGDGSSEVRGVTLLRYGLEEDERK